MTKRMMLIDEPNRYGPNYAEWEKHLAFLESLPDDISGRDERIEYANLRIAEKRRANSRLH
jgi:hypothetical protein